MAQVKSNAAVQIQSSAHGQGPGQPDYAELRRTERYWSMGFPAARLGDMTVTGDAITGPGAPMVLIMGPTGSLRW